MRANLALDLGATKLSVKLRYNETIIEDIFQLPSLSNFQEEFIQVKTFLNKILHEMNNDTPISCVCSCAASISPEGIILRWPNRAYWDGYNLKQLLEEIIGPSVHFEDDGNAAAYAEAISRGESNLIYVGLGTGIAGGVIVNHEILKGVRGQAAEFGHICAEPNGEECSCGKKGCLQAYASGKSILKKAYKERWLNKSRDDLIRDLGNNNASIVGVINTASMKLAKVFIDLNEVLDISTIVIGGGFGARFSELHARINFYAKQFLRQGQELNILPAYFEHASSLEGAFLLSQKD